MPMKEKERIQYINFESIKRNFHRIFGKQNDAMAEVFFRYASECNSDNIKTTRVNYHNFINKFSILFPPKIEIKEGMPKKNP
jgi:hypothetical protein